MSDEDQCGMAQVALAGAAVLVGALGAINIARVPPKRKARR